MLLNNLAGWFRDPLAWNQLISWVLLVISLVLVILGVKLLREVGRQNAGRSVPTLLGLEKTSNLVTAGLYRYINRPPIYAGMLLWAIAQPVLLQNWLVGFPFLLFYVPLFLMRLPREEQQLLDNFGE